jgi:hypothetical protein
MYLLGKVFRRSMTTWKSTASCMRFGSAYNLGNFLRRLTLPKVVKEWSLQSVQLKLIKTGARLVRHARRLVFQMAEVAVPSDVWAAEDCGPLHFLER